MPLPTGPWLFLPAISTTFFRAGAEGGVGPQDARALPPPPRPVPERLAEVDLLGGVQIQAEAADLPERLRPAEHERARRPAQRPRQQVPQADAGVPDPGRLV